MKILFVLAFVLFSTAVFGVELTCNSHARMLTVTTDLAPEWGINVKLEDWHHLPLFPKIDPRITSVQWMIVKTGCARAGGGSLICGNNGDDQSYVIWDKDGKQIQSDAFDNFSTNFYLVATSRWITGPTSQDQTKIFEYTLKVSNQWTNKVETVAGSFELFPGNECAH